MPGKRVAGILRLMTTCFFVSDLHGRIERYRALIGAIRAERPACVFIGGDILPRPGSREHGDFIADYLLPQLEAVREALGNAYPRVFVILGNDDPRAAEEPLAGSDLVSYIHNRREPFGRWMVYGYANVPPSPFLLKDWERYDVSRFVDPGCVSPEEGFRTVEVPDDEVRYGTIAGDLEALVGDENLSSAVFLLHAPPHKTSLDRAALDGRMVDHVPLDVHVGSIAIRRFIEERRPMLTLHGHIHESARLTGSWIERIGPTVALSAAHDGPELALIRLDLEDPGGAVREFIG